MSFSDGNLDYTDLSANASILGTQIADGTIQLRNIAPAAITGGTGGGLALATITNDNLVAGTIIAASIAAGSITSNEIATNTIQAGNMAANSIVTAAISAGAVTATQIASGTITGTQIAASTITGTNISAMNLTGKTLTADTGTIGGFTISATELVGVSGSDIRSGQSDFNVGTGFWLGNVGGTPKFSIGTQGGNSMRWDGTNLIVTGAFTASTVMQTFVYTTANLPIPPSSIGFNSPAGNS